MSREAPNPKRQPVEESVGLYPGLVVHDGRMSGVITAGPSRIPVRVLIGESFGWDSIFVPWSIVSEDFGYTKEDFASFLGDLLQAPGELGRFLLLLAEAQRRWEIDVQEPYLIRLRRDQGNPDDFPFVVLDVGSYPRPWWGHEELRAPVLAQLRRVLAALDPDKEKSD